MHVSMKLFQEDANFTHCYYRIQCLGEFNTLVLTRRECVFFRFNSMITSIFTPYGPSIAYVDFPTPTLWMFCMPNMAEIDKIVLEKGKKNQNWSMYFIMVIFTILPVSPIV